MSDAAKPGPATMRHQRSAKNYLLDRHFQLKYTGYLMGVALLLSVVLGGVLYRTSSKVIEQSQRTVEEGKQTVKSGQETIALGRKVIDESRKVNAVVAMNISDQYKDNPDLAQVFGEETAAKQIELDKQQESFEKNAADLEKRSAQLEQQAADVAFQQRVLLVGLIAGMALLVIAIGLAGIVVTHKVAGPIFKMKRLLRQIGEGKLILRERLRKGDELQHFFDTFEKMVDDLRKHQQGEIAKVDAVLEKLESAPPSERGSKETEASGLGMLKKLRQEMQDQLEA